MISDLEPNETTNQTTTAMIHKIHLYRRTPTGDRVQLAAVAICDHGRTLSPALLLHFGRLRAKDLVAASQLSLCNESAVYSLVTAKRPGVVTPSRTVARWEGRLREGANV